MALKILTVDDSRTIRLIITKAFRSFDCEVTEASNGMEGLTLAAKVKPDLIILDITMPVMDGYETLTKLKADPVLKAIPVVMLTAEAGRENVLRIARLGVRDYLVKPFKEELVIERVGRILPLKPKGEAPPKAKRFEDPLDIFLVDDKPAIVEIVRAGLADTPWKLETRPTVQEAADYCGQKTPDFMLISLSLPADGAYTLFQIVRAGARTKTVPVFAVCVKTAAEEQDRAQSAGFTGIITKPIDLDDLKLKIVRTLSLDTSSRYFQQTDGVFVFRLPPQFTRFVANDVTLHLRRKMAEAVDGGLDKMVMDLGQVEKADVGLVKLGLSVVQMCQELSVHLRVIASAAVLQECAQFEETREWPYSATCAEAIATLHGRQPAPV